VQLDRADAMAIALVLGQLELLVPPARLDQQVQLELLVPLVQLEQRV
jgi:hypothetical protein